MTTAQLGLLLTAVGVLSGIMAWVGIALVKFGRRSQRFEDAITLQGSRAVSSEALIRAEVKTAQVMSEQASTEAANAIKAAQEATNAARDATAKAEESGTKWNKEMIAEFRNVVDEVRSFKNQIAGFMEMRRSMNELASLVRDLVGRLAIIEHDHERNHPAPMAECTGRHSMPTGSWPVRNDDDSVPEVVECGPAKKNNPEEDR